MFRPVSLFVGLRYTRAKRRNHFISFISLVSMIGIALGVMVLITVLSVMNGFDREIKKRVFTMVPPMTISSVTGYIAGWQDLQKTMTEFPAITASAPFATGEVLLSSGGGAAQPALLTGVLPAEAKKVSAVAEKMVQGRLSDLQAGKFGIVLGENLASLLDVSPGDKVTVFVPQVTISPAGVIPRAKRFTVVGIFKAGGGFGFDRGLGFIHLNDAQKLMGLGDNVTGLHLNIKDVYAAPSIARDLMTQLSPTASITTWADQFGEFFHAVQLEKTMMFFILLLIIAVAAFNLVATLVMVVNEKQSDIAILRTFGATPNMIMNIFIVQGGLIGVFGTLLGVVLGVLLAWNVTDIVNWIEHVFRVQFLSSNVYFVNYLPSEIEWMDVVKISVAALFLSLIATIYPAWRASKMDPVESLRYE
ncbi:lipoprotein-releasing ABC transporter permease subunit [Aquicella lusitana]|uniref:Lipoprotein-releasing system permease protein n=1 Tax=Aquicella lusitana TaxID=254246 RepID=A0A370GR87_9COXI|nr:lipoprotein-releasing ABC transporter permease subunit [Aquicella lusitana]RDI46021.1 lipoprotein-releasing system permease protein [Aquicella lusitana]VVC73382.1 Lipoprotein-releasing system transmembrane protein LolE [Aquicella lusitana]